MLRVFAVMLAGLIGLVRCGARSLPPPPLRPGWTDVATHIPDAILDIRYATADNFTGAPLYPVARCLLRTPVAERLAVAAAVLRRAGHRLILWDCYRPASIQRELWRRVPDPRYVAEPTFDDAGKPIGGSKHSRGAAVDVSLAALDGTPRPMPTAHDAFARFAGEGIDTARIRSLGPEASGAGATGAPARHHAALRAAMERAGFAPLPTEWWHYDSPDWTSYALDDTSL